MKQTKKLLSLALALLLALGLLPGAALADEPIEEFSFTFTLDENYDGGQTSAFTFEHPTLYVLPELTRDGFEFFGWSLSPVGGPAHLGGDEIYLAGDLTLYGVWENVQIQDGYHFLVSNNEAVVRWYNGSGTDLVVPELLGGAAVTAIGDRAFEGCTGLTGVTLPSGVTSLGNYAFKGCTSLAEVDLGNVTSLGNGVFQNCSSLEAVTVPPGVTSIGTSAFYGCTSLTDVDLGNVTSIGVYAFYGCSSLEAITVPPSVISIGKLTFCGCTALKDVDLGSVTSIGPNTFQNCTSLEAVTVPPGVTAIVSQTFYGCTSLKDIDLGNVTSFGPYVFQNCTSLTDFTVPPGVTDIPSGTFKDCTSLAHVDLNNVTSIGSNAFNGCTGLTSVDLGKLTEIPDRLLDGFASLTSVTIPATVTSIGNSAFSGCSSLTSVTIPSAMTEIGYKAFQNCTGLTQVDLGNVTNIGKNAFDGCTGLARITIPAGLTTLQSYLFRDCTGLRAVALPAELTRVGSSCFLGCSALTDVYFAGTEEQWSAVTVMSGNDPLTNAAMHYNAALPASLSILTQPVDYTGPVGSRASFTVAAEGEGLSYQWWVKSRTATKFSKSSVVSAVYSVTLTEANAGRQLYCVVSDAAGNSVQTDTVSMTAAEPIAILTQPVDYTGPVGSTAAFTVVAEGEGLSYQWYVKSRTATKFSKSSGVSAVYSVTLTEANAGRQLYCVVSDAEGNAVRTNTVTMTLGPAFTVAPLADYVGPEGSTASFTVVAEGEGLSYQWYVKKPTAAKFSKSAITGDTYAVTLTAARNGNQVYCVVTDSSGNTVRTNTATMTVGTPLTVAPLTDYVGPEGSTASFTVAAEGEGLSYQWYVKKPTAKKFSRSSITGAVYSVELTAARNGNQVYCVVTDSSGNTVRTNTATMTIG